MEPLSAEIFHHSSKDHEAGHPPFTNTDPTNWPEEWKTVYYKEYPRFEKISLPFSALPEKNFETIVTRRTSTRSYDETKTLSVVEMSQLLKYSCGLIREESENLHRIYPSGGGLYPLEVYPIVFRGNEELPSGIYHYNPKDHCLDILWKHTLSNEEIDSLVIYPWVKHAAGCIMVTATFSRALPKYGERGYRQLLLEAGHLGHALYLAAETLAIKGCALSGCRDQKVETLLDIDGYTESMVHAFVFGK